MHDKKNYFALIKVLKQALDCRLILKKVNKVIEFKQEAWLNSYININTALRKKAKNHFKKYLNLN